MSKETVEEYLARGGEIAVVPFGVSKERIQMKRTNERAERFTYIRGSYDNFNNKKARDLRQDQVVRGTAHPPSDSGGQG